LSRMRSEVTSRSNWAKDRSTLRVRRPIELVVLNCRTVRCPSAVDFVDHDDVDLAGPDIVQKPLQVGTVGRSSGVTAIVTTRPEEGPAGMGLAPDIGRVGLVLRIEGVKVLIKALISRDPRVDRTTDPRN
jgi:hypothetical protein